MPDLFSLDSLIALLTLTSLEIILGIDNVVFLAIVTSRLPKEQRARARTLGLGLAMGMRILLLLAISWMMGLTATWFTVLGHETSGRDLILLGGGLFLIAKATFEIHARIEGPEASPGMRAGRSSLAGVLLQVAILDLVFSLDSVITAVGMASHLEIMIVAIVIAVGVMMALASRISAFIERHPSLKVLALSFLLLIGVMLVAEGAGRHVEKGYIYFAMVFSLFVEIVNIRVQRRSGAPGAAPPPA